MLLVPFTRQGIASVRSPKSGGRLSRPVFALAGGRLYVGRSILEARNISLDIGAPLFIVSAGIGLVVTTD